jgi:two-component system alkaline phosphatase synthesis response regulator PhoP
VRANLRKRTVVATDGELTVNSIKLNQDSRTVSIDGHKIPVTQKEFELLKHLMLNAGNVVEREKLLREVWGYEYLGESRTVDIHMKNLREKLGDEATALQSVRGVGYVLKCIRENV